MTILHAGWAQLRRAAELLLQGTDPAPKNGVWITHIPRQARLAKVVMVLAQVGMVACLWWAMGRNATLWLVLVLMVAGKCVSESGQAMAAMLDRDPTRPPSNTVFVYWAGLTALVGLPLAHLVLYLAPMLGPLALHPWIEKFFPEIYLGVVAGASYWRLLIVRLWFERLAAEQLRREAAEQGQALAETRLHMLEAQIEPHFLFNTLTAVQHLVRQDAAQADFLLARLITYLRQAIPEVRGAASTLGREFALVRTYLDIVQVRMGDRLEVSVACDGAVAALPFPALVVHTLVENAVTHGLETTPGKVSIAVTASAGPGSTVEIIVDDSGAGMGGGVGTGLRNIGERLALAYQGQATLTVGARPGGGVRAAVSIPAPLACMQPNHPFLAE